MIVEGEKKKGTPKPPDGGKIFCKSFLTKKKF